MPPTALWTHQEETFLVNFLVEKKAEAGDGGNFKKATFQSAATALAPLRERGTAKGVKSIQNKWTAFRRLYRIIRAIQSVSGWVWSNETGASITADSASSWDDYVKIHPEAKPFRNKGWVHFDKVDSLMPSTVAGANVYHASSCMALDTLSDNTPEDSSSTPGSPVAPAPIEDDSSSESDNEPPTSTPPPSTKRRAPAASKAPVAKRPRASHGASALMDMSQSLSGFSQAFTAALAPPPPTGLDPSPLRKTKAVACILKLEKAWLNNYQVVSLIDFLRADQTAADIYMALDEEDVRKEWVRIQLEKLGINVE